MRDDVIFNTIQLVSDSSDLQAYVVHEAWKAIRDTDNCTEKQPLTQVSCWCIGEYGSGLLNGVSVEGETLTVSEEEVIEVYHKILWAKNMSLITKQYALMSVTKLSTRFPNATPKIQDIIDKIAKHMEIDLQQRGVEFSVLFRQHDSMRSALLEPMPPMERDNKLEVNGGSNLESNVELISSNDLGSISIIGETNSAANAGDSLLDLIDNSLPVSSNALPGSSSNGGQDSILDLLDINLSSSLGPAALPSNSNSILGQR